MRRLRTAARRCGMTGFTAVAAAAALAALPVVAAANLLAAVVRCLVPGAPRARWRAVRLCAFLVGYTCVDLAGVAVAVALRCRVRPGGASGDAAAAYYRLLRRLLAVLLWLARPLFGVRFRIDAPEGVASVLPPHDRPLLVVCRHAGPGDSFLLVYALLSAFALRPMIVLTDTLRLDPALDLILGRLPVYFVRGDAPAVHHAAAAADGPRLTDNEQGIATLAASVRPGDALVLFPEGGNFTEERRRRALRRLRRTAPSRLVWQAEGMSRVLPPHPGGMLAALRAAPGADVVIVAHTGLDAVLSVRDLWQAIPLPGPVAVTWWHVRAEDLPPTDDARRDWLFDRWRDVDTWIGRQRRRPETSEVA